MSLYYFLISISKKQGEFLSELIDNLIALTSLDAQPIEVTTTPVEIENLVQEISAVTRESALGKGLQFIVDIEPNLPTITADKPKIIRMLKNLLSNAVKFTEQGAITVHIRRIDEGIHIAITDSGIGISEEYFEKIDKYYERLHAGYTYPDADEDDPDYNHPFDEEEHFDESDDDYEEDEEKDVSDYLNEDLWDGGDGWDYDDEMEWIEE